MQMDSVHISRITNRGKSMSVLLLFLLTLASTSGIQGNGSFVVRFEPESAFVAVEDETLHILWFTNSTEEINRLDVTTDNTENSEVTNYSQPISYQTNEEAKLNITYYGEINMTTLFVGFNTLHMRFFDKDDNVIGEVMKNQKVLLKSHVITVIFSYFVMCSSAVFSFFMGVTLDLQIILHFVRRPLGPAIGIICQYGLMPVIGYLLGLLFFPEDYPLRLGLFLNGCSPGGGPSNMWTHLLEGSLDLSITMTTISIITSFGALPLWVFTVGPTIAPDGSFFVPFWDMATTLIALIVPLVVGIITQKVFPKFLKYAKKVMTPISTTQILLVSIFGTYAYFYIIYLITWKVILAVLLLPLIGYIVGMTLAKLFRMSWKEAIAVGIETGIQSTVPPNIILALAIEQPLGSLAAVITCSYQLLLPVPLTIVYIIKRIYQKVKGRGTSEETKTVTELEHTPAHSKDKKQELNSEGGITNPAVDLRDEE